MEALSRRRKTSQGLARRARIVLAAAEGLENKEIAVRLEAMGKWRRRYAAEGLDGLYDEPRPGAPRQIGDDAIAEARLTLEETPPDATHWSLRSMARASGHAPSTIHRIWRAFGLQPHRSETFKLSSDPFFVDPRHRRSVFGAAGSCPGSLCRRKEPDPGLGPFPDAPRAGGAAQPRLQAPRHDLSLRGPRHRHGRDHRQMFPAPSGPRVPQIPRPRRGERPCDLEIHIVMDNYGTHKTKAIRDWFAKRPRWQAHFGLLAQPGRALRFLLTDKQIRRGVHHQRTILDCQWRSKRGPPWRLRRDRRLRACPLMGGPRVRRGVPSTGRRGGARGRDLWAHGVKRRFSSTVGV